MIYSSIAGAAALGIGVGLHSIQTIHAHVDHNHGTLSTKSDATHHQLRRRLDKVGLSSAHTAGCYPIYSSSDSAYLMHDWVSASVKTKTPITSVQCTVGTPSCVGGYKREGGESTNRKHNFKCISNAWCSDPVYAPGSIYESSAWEKESAICSGSATLATTPVPVAWSGTGCPESYSGGTEYTASDHVSVNKGAYALVYSCNEGPSNQWCGMVGYEPEVGQYWTQAWTFKGSCSGTMPPTNAPNFEDLESLGGCPGTFDGGVDYEEGDKISKDGFVYKCKGWPESQHCSQVGYEPKVDVGVVEHWKQAWDIIGHCLGTITPTSSPSFVFLEDVGGCPDAWMLKGASDPYEEGDMVANNNLVFKCNAWPHSSHCGQSGYEPNVSPATPDAWRVAWALVGHCSGSIGPTTSPNYDSAKTVGACPDEWVGGIHTKYEEGDMVSVTVSNIPLRKVSFKCKAWPYNGYCGQFSPTQHGGNLGWSVVGSCDGTNSPTVAPSPYGGTCTYTKCTNKSNCIPGSTSNGNSGSSNCSCGTDDVRTSSCKQTVCKDVAINPYSSSVSYDFGDVVRVGSKKFRCRGYPHGQWCKQKIFAPSLVAGIWSSAWKMDGTCPPEPIVIKTTTVTWTINPASLGVTIPSTLPTGSELTTLVNTLKSKIKAQIEAFLSPDQEVEDITIISVGGTSINLRRLKKFVVSTNNVSRSLTANKVKYRAEIKYSCLVRECDQIRSAVEETAKLEIETPTPAPTPSPTDVPTKEPTSVPTDIPTREPTFSPTDTPTKEPSSSPTDVPTKEPTSSPTDVPNKEPTSSPTDVPTEEPSSTPTDVPTKEPTFVPTDVPTKGPTSTPTDVPTKEPTSTPTDVPTKAPTSTPTVCPKCDEIDLGTFVSNEGTMYGPMKPFMVDDNTYVFGAPESGWFKMRAVNRAGEQGESRYTSAISNLSQLTIDIWNSAYVYGNPDFYNVVDIIKSVKTGCCDNLS